MSKMAETIPSDIRGNMSKQGQDTDVPFSCYSYTTAAISALEQNYCNHVMCP